MCGGPSGDAPYWRLAGCHAGLFRSRAGVELPPSRRRLRLQSRCRLLWPRVAAAAAGIGDGFGATTAVQLAARLGLIDDAAAVRAAALVRQAGRVISDRPPIPPPAITSLSTLSAAKFAPLPSVGFCAAPYSRSRALRNPISGDIRFRPSVPPGLPCVHVLAPMLQVCPTACTIPTLAWKTGWAVPSTTPEKAPRTTRGCRASGCWS